MIVAKTKTYKLVTTVVTTQGKTTIAILRRGRGPKGGVYTAKGNEYGFSGLTEPSSTCENRRPRFIRSTLERFSIRGAVRFFGRVKVCPLGEGNCLCPEDGRTRDIMSMLYVRTTDLNIGVGAGRRIARVGAKAGKGGFRVLAGK